MTAVAARTRNGLPPARNRRATASVALGLLAVAAVPLGIALSRLTAVTLVQGCTAAAPALLLGVLAVAQARRGRETAQMTLGRSGGERASRIGRALGMAALWMALTTGLALGFYGLLMLFAD